VEAMWLMLQVDQPEDFVIATGITTSVRDFLHLAFGQIGFKLDFIGTGVSELGVLCGIDYDVAFEKLGKTKEELPTAGEVMVKVDPEYFRPTEVDLLIGSPDKAAEKLGWKPKYKLKELVKEMVSYDLQILRREICLIEGGFDIISNS